MDRSGWLHIVLLAGILTGLNACKPLHVDDCSFYIYAREFAQHPSRPYDFTFGTPEVRPAIDYLMPPMWPYWIALGLSLWGDHPVIWKLWAFPFALMFIASLAFLLRRFAPAVQKPLLWMTVLSPGFLPSFNLMLEIPVLGLGLTALVLAMKGCERSSWGLILLAGSLAAIALQTKYTAAAPLGAMLLWCLWARRPGFFIAILVLTFGFFIGWECVIANIHSHSHFLIQLGQRQGGSVGRMLRLVLPMVTIAGALMPAVSLVGLAALGWTSSRLIAVGTMAILGHGALALIPDVTSEGGKPLVELHQLLFGSLGLLAWGMILGVCRRLWQGDATDSSQVHGTLAADRFLIVWLVGEVAIYFLVSPFPAARRILGVIVVVTLLVGRLAQRTCQSQRQMFWIRCITAGGMALGFVYFAADWFDAQVAQQSATTAATEWQPAPGGTAWFADLHGFGFYAERAGLKPLALNRDRPRKGDILFAPVKPFCSINLVHLESHGFREVGQIKLADWFPLRTYVNYYSGRSPLVRVRGPRFVVNVFQFSPEIRSDTEQAGRPAAKADATDSSR